ncbi:MAG: hypothetical protein GXO36_03135 [Chloroflexi bacterium]|nr:hypothetical protein [Chloroflexota bacterium]
MRIFGQSWRQLIANFLMALLLSVMLWAWAQVEQHPTERRTYRVQLEVRNVPEGLLVLNREVLEQYVSITLLAPQDVIRTLSPTEVLHAWVDLAGLTEGEHEVPVNVKADDPFIRILSYEPQTVTVVLEAFARKKVPVLVAIRGVSETSRHRSFKVTPSMVTVEGPAHIVRQVVAAQAIVWVEDDPHTLIKKVSVTPVDRNNEPVSGVSVIPSEVEVRISSLVNSRNAAVRVVLKGQPARGYHIAQVQVEPAIVTLYAHDKEVLDQIDFVETEPIRIDGVSGDISKRVPLQVPEGVLFVEPATVQVNISIEPLFTTLTLSDVPIKLKGVASGLRATVEPDRVDLLLNGPVPGIEKLDPQADIEVVVDVTNLSVGEYTLEPQVWIKEDLGITVVQITPPSVKVTLTLEATPTPTPTPTSTPAASPTP